MELRAIPRRAGRLLRRTRRALWHRRVALVQVLKFSPVAALPHTTQTTPAAAVSPVPVSQELGDGAAPLGSQYAGQLLRPGWLPRSIRDQIRADRRRLLVIHVPKTGGSSLRVMFEGHVPPEQTFVSTGAHEWVGRSAADLSSMQLFVGHQFLEPLYQFPEDDWVTALAVRDPLAWWRSWYKYHRRRDDLAPGPATMPQTFGAFVDANSDLELSNPQASWLLARTRVMFDNPRSRADRISDTGMNAHGDTGPDMDLLDRLLERVTALGTTEQLVEVYRTACRAMDWEPSFDVAPRENRTRRSEDVLVLTPAQQERLLGLNRIDAWMVGRAAAREAPH